MIVAWFVGVNGVTSGCGVVALLHSGIVPDRASIERSMGSDGEPTQAFAAVNEAARVRALVEERSTAFPLGVAKLLLSAALVAAAATALAGRPGARSFAMQAVALYALFSIVDFALSGSIRASWIPEVAAAARQLAVGSPSPIPIGDASTWWWFERLRFGIIDLATMAAALLALAASRTKAFFAAMALDAATVRREDGE